MPREPSSRSHHPCRDHDGHRNWCHHHLHVRSHRQIRDCPRRCRFIEGHGNPYPVQCPISEGQVDLLFRQIADLNVQLVNMVLDIRPIQREFQRRERLEDERADREQERRRREDEALQAQPSGVASLEFLRSWGKALGLLP
jgi:hypothetical protein